jgi:hypothetical protein
MFAQELAQSSHGCPQATLLPIMNRHTLRIDNQGVTLRVVRCRHALNRSDGQARVFRRAGYDFQFDADGFGYRL